MKNKDQILLENAYVKICEQRIYFKNAQPIPRNIQKIVDLIYSIKVGEQIIFFNNRWNLANQWNEGTYIGVQKINDGDEWIFKTIPYTKYLENDQAVKFLAIDILDSDDVMIDLDSYEIKEINK